MTYSIFGLFLGLLAAIVVYLIERTTGAVHWPLVISFPICWSIGGYLFWKWNIGGIFRRDE